MLFWEYYFLNKQKLFNEIHPCDELFEKNLAKKILIYNFVKIKRKY